MEAGFVMAREKTLFHLPDYRGPLGPAPWSAMVLTPELARSLQAAALKGCPACKGAGYTSRDEKAHPCHCLSRRQEPAVERP